MLYLVCAVTHLVKQNSLLIKRLQNFYKENYAHILRGELKNLLNFNYCMRIIFETNNYLMILEINNYLMILEINNYLMILEKKTII